MGEVVALSELGGIDCCFLESEEWQEIARIARNKNGKRACIVVSKKGGGNNNTLILLNMGMNVKLRPNPSIEEHLHESSSLVSLFIRGRMPSSFNTRGRRVVMRSHHFADTRREHARLPPRFFLVFRVFPREHSRPSKKCVCTI